MTSSLNDTTLSTLSLLESRLLQIEHLLYGQSDISSGQEKSATLKLADLERRFNALTSHIRVYGELLKIYRAHPDFFHSPDPSEAPTQLTNDAILSIVLSAASTYPATLSALTAIKDSQIPDPAESAALLAQAERMTAIEATQLAQAAEIAELRTRSEAVLRSWYESSILSNSQLLADVEGRVEKIERQVKRVERIRDEDEAI
ncbi:unnamed protein product [Clonostachys rosea f. rosea IK726]|uniref:Uncharacterized protein n=2 Tax=Bionectria ochroleuca TaxID=29856 RepID=A0A0B7K013_BIOOC|nr:unnamed protein product [Clonostachys rosea f. rosea IK726]